MLFLQAKAQALVNKAVEADDKLNKHKSLSPDEADTSMGWFKKGLLHFGSAISNGAINSREIIKSSNKAAYDKMTKELSSERDKLLKEAATLEKQAANIGKEYHIGGHAAPSKAKKKKEEEKTKTSKAEQLAKELLALQRKNRQEEIDLLKESSDKKRKQIKENYENELADLKAQEDKWRKVQKGHLTKEQEGALAESRNLAAKKKQHDEDEVNKEEEKKRLEQKRNEVQAMSEYLKTYGSFQQQKLAIAEEYAQQIAAIDVSEVSEATKRWQKAKLLKERQEREASMSFEEISRGIDWNALFSGVGNLTKEMMGPMLEQLRAYVETDDYKNASADTQQKVTDLLQQMRQYIGTDQSVTWQKLAEAIRKFNESVTVYDSAVKSEKVAVKARDNGKKLLQEGKISEVEYQELEKRAQELGDATVIARKNMDDFGKSLNRTSDEVANFTSGLTTALNNAKDGEVLRGLEKFNRQLDKQINLKAP